MKRVQTILAILITVSMPTASMAVSNSRPPIPSVPLGHPRVYVRPDDLLSIKTKLEMPEFAEDWTVVKRDRRPLSKAFVSLMTGDEIEESVERDGALRIEETCWVIGLPHFFLRSSTDIATICTGRNACSASIEFAKGVKGWLIAHAS